MGTILAIDPGNIQSGYVLAEHDGKEIRKVLDVGKVPNGEIFPILCREYQHLAIEMVAGMGMPVGAEVFDTCFWIGRFWEYVDSHGEPRPMQKIFRREEKLYLCGRASAKEPAPGRGSCRRWTAFASGTTYRAPTPRAVIGYEMPGGRQRPTLVTCPAQRADAVDSHDPAVYPRSRQ